MCNLCSFPLEFCKLVSLVTNWILGVRLSYDLLRLGHKSNVPSNLPAGLLAFGVLNCHGGILNTLKLPCCEESQALEGLYRVLSWLSPWVHSPKEGPRWKLAPCQTHEWRNLLMTPDSDHWVTPNVSRGPQRAYHVYKQKDLCLFSLQNQWSLLCFFSYRGCCLEIFHSFLCPSPALISRSLTKKNYFTDSSTWPLQSG